MKTKNLFEWFASLRVLTFVLLMLYMLPVGKAYAKITYDWQSEYINADLQSVKIGDLYYDLNSKTRKAAVVLEHSIFDNAELGLKNYKELTSVDVPATVTFALALQDEITYDVVEIGCQAFHRNGISDKFTHLSLPSSIRYIGKYMLSSNTNNIAQWENHGVYLNEYLFDFQDSKNDLGLYVSNFHVRKGTHLIANKIIHGATIKQLYFQEDNVILSGDIFYLDSKETNNLEMVELWGTTIDGYFIAADDAVTIYNYSGEIDYTTETYNSLKTMYVTRDVARHHTTGNNAKWKDKVKSFRFQVGDLYFELLNKDEAVVVSSNSYALLSKEVVIPDKVTDNGHTFMVTKIDDEAFKGAAFTKVTLPSTISSVPLGVFSGCTNLSKVIFPDEMKTIGQRAFENCTALKEISLNNVANIASEAFKGCTSLTTLIADSKSVINAHSLAFDGLNKSNITVQVSDALVSKYKADSFWKDFKIASNRYKVDGIWYEKSGKKAKVVKEKSGTGNYSELTGKVTIPKDVVIEGTYCTVTAIEPGAFQYAPFEELDIRCQVTVLPEGCCFAMPNLTTITLPETLLKIEDNAFNACEKLTYYSDKPFGSYFMLNWCESLTSIGEMAFANTFIRETYLPEGLTSIGEYAFLNCTHMNEVHIRSKVTTIGEGAFSGCTKLEKIYNDAFVPQSFTPWMLDGADKDKLEIWVPYGALNAYRTADGWKDYNFSATPFKYYFDKDVFLYFSLDEVAMTATVIADYVNIDDPKNNYCNLLSVKTLEIPSEVETDKGTYTVTAIDERALCYTSFEKVVIPSTVSKIGREAFKYSPIKEVVLPSSLRLIDMYAFYDCTKLKSVVVPEGIDKINYCTFGGCSALESVVLPSTLKSIGESAFVRCIKLSSFTIPENVTEIGDNAFENCVGLYEIHNLNSTPQKINADVFDGLTISSINLYVPPTRKDAYDAAEVWKDFNVKEMKAIVDGLHYTLNPAAGTAKLTFDELVNNYAGLSGKVTIPASIIYNDVTYQVTEIGNYAFQGNKTITELVLPEGLVRIGHDCFENMTKLASINIPSTVTYIARFASDNNLLSNDYLYTKSGLLYIDNCLIKAKTTASGNIEVEDGTRLIAAYAFSGCKDIDKLILPQSIKEIGEYAFKGCKSLDEIDWPESVTVIRRGVFQDANVGGYYGFNIPSAVTEIERDAFGWGGTGCTNLYFMRIPENVRKIGAMAFWQSALRQVWLPAGIEEIGDVAFGNLDALQEVHCFATDPSTIKLGINVFYEIPIGTKLYVPYGCRERYTHAEQWSVFDVVEMNPCIDGFYYSLNKTNHTATLTYEVYSEDLWYAKYTNYEDRNTESWTIPGKIAFENEVYDVKTVGDHAFQHTNVKKIIFSEGIETLGEDAMSDCSDAAPQEIRLPSTLKNLGKFAFSYSTENLQVIYNYATEPQDIKDKGVFNSELDKSKVVLRVPFGSASKYKEADEWKDFTIVELPVCIDGIYYSLDKSNNIASVINQKEWNNNLSELMSREIIVIPGSITVDEQAYKVRIWDDAFQGCTGSSILSISEGVTSIGATAFEKSGFTMIALPSTIEEIGFAAFRDCENLLIIRNFAKTPLAIDANPFNGYTKQILQVPSGCKEAYDDADVWKEFTIQEMAVCIDGIFYSLDDENLTATVTVDYAGRAYSDLGKEVVLPEQISVDEKTYSVTIISPVAFMNNKVLETITLPSLLSVINQQAFSGCSALKTIINERPVPAAVEATVFDGISPSACTLFVHIDDVASYKAADVWNKFNIVSIESPIVVAGQSVRDDQYGKPLTGEGIIGEVIVTASGVWIGDGASIRTHEMDVPAIEIFPGEAINTFFIGGKNATIYGGANSAIRIHGDATLNLNTHFNAMPASDGLLLDILSESEDGVIAFANGSEVTLNINSASDASCSNIVNMVGARQCLGLPPSAHCDIHAGGNVDFVSNDEVSPIGYFTSDLTLHKTYVVLPFGGSVKEEGIFDFAGNESFRLHLAAQTTQSGQPYPVALQGFTITDGNKADILGDGTCSYDNTTNTLTLKGAEVDDANGQVLHATAGLNLKVEGKSQLS